MTFPSSLTAMFTAFVLSSFATAAMNRPTTMPGRSCAVDFFLSTGVIPAKYSWTCSCNNKVLNVLSTTTTGPLSRHSVESAVRCFDKVRRKLYLVDLCAGSPDLWHARSMLLLVTCVNESNQLSSSHMVSPLKEGIEEGRTILLDEASGLNYEKTHCKSVMRMHPTIRVMKAMFSCRCVQSRFPYFPMNSPFTIIPGSASLTAKEVTSSFRDIPSAVLTFLGNCVHESQRVLQNVCQIQPEKYQKEAFNTLRTCCTKRTELFERAGINCWATIAHDSGLKY